MVLAYWLIGREIVVELQGGKGRATYGNKIVESLSVRLTERYGKGFSKENLNFFRKFYAVYSDRITIPYPVGTELDLEPPIPSPLGIESLPSPIPTQRAEIPLKAFRPSSPGPITAPLTPVAASSLWYELIFRWLKPFAVLCGLGVSWK